MSLIRKLWTPAPEQRLFSSSSRIPHPGSMEDVLYDNGAGATDQQALQFIAVFACVAILSDGVSAMPVDVFRKQKDSRVEVAPPKWLVSPAKGETMFSWLWMLMQSLALRGNSYHWIDRDADGKIMELIPIHPDAIKPRLNTKTGDCEYVLSGEVYTAEDILHIRRFPVPGVALGLSPITVGAPAISIGRRADQYGERYFKDSASPSSVLETDVDLSEAASDHLQKQWISTHGGRRRPAVLSNGLKWKPITLNPDDAQFIETKTFQRSEIAMLYRVPPHMLGDNEKQTSFGTGIEQQSIGFVTYTLNPWLACIEQALNQLLPNKQFAKFNVSSLLRGDQKARFEAYTAGLQSGIFSVNEVRALEDLPPIGPEGDIHLQALNFGPLGTEPTPDSAKGHGGFGGPQYGD